MTKTRYLFFLFFINVAALGQSGRLRMPAEWEQQQAVIVNYSGNSRDLITTEKVHKVCRDIIRDTISF